MPLGRYPLNAVYFGRTYSTDFSNPAADSAMFRMMNIAYTTDGGVPVIHAADTVNQAYILTKSEDFRNTEILLRVRVNSATSGFSPWVISRGAIFGTSVTRRWYFHQDWNAGTLTVTTDGTTGGGSIVTADTVRYQWIKVRTWEFQMYVKVWWDGDAEPSDWVYYSNTNTGTLSARFTEYGLAGINLFNDQAVYVSNLSITELLPNDPDYSYRYGGNQEAGLMKATDTLPLYWTLNGTSLAASSVSFVNQQDPDGNWVNKSHIVRTYGWVAAPAAPVITSSSTGGQSRPGPIPSRFVTTRAMRQ